MRNSNNSSRSHNRSRKRTTMTSCQLRKATMRRTGRRMRLWYVIATVIPSYAHRQTELLRSASYIVTHNRPTNSRTMKITLTAWGEQEMTTRVL